MYAIRLCGRPRRLVSTYKYNNSYNRLESGSCALVYRNQNRSEILLSLSSTAPVSALNSCHGSHNSRGSHVLLCLNHNIVPSILLHDIFQESCRLGLLGQLSQVRFLHSSKFYYNNEQKPAPETISPDEETKENKKPSSKVEESVKVIKEELKGKVIALPPKRSLWKRIEDEILHYYHGFRLLLLDTRLSITLINRVLNGQSLSRREHRQLIRTTSDLFRLVPFSVFIIVPFMELLLPVFLKFFPGMLPSTFQTKNDRENKMKAQLKVKLEMAKFLQQTLDDMSLQSKGHSSEKAKEFATFFNKIRTSGSEVSNEEILKFSKLFEDEITLDSLSRQQLVALCRVLEIPPLGNNTLLRFQLRMKLRSLNADDKAIEAEGVDTLTVQELQLACKARGMRAVGVDEERLQRQLTQWLQLSLHEKIPPSLLLLSRAMYLPEDLPATAKLQATLSALPEAAATQTKAAIGEREGKLDHKTRIEVIKEEERKIKEERQESLKEKEAKEKEKEEILRQRREKEAAKPSEEQIDKTPISQQPDIVLEEVLREAEEAPLKAKMKVVPEFRPKRKPSVAATIGRRLSRNVPHPLADLLKERLTREDADKLETALDNLGVENKRLYIEKEELQDLKEEMADYQEDVRDLQKLTKSGGKPIDVKETKAAKRLFKRVNKMISHMDSVVEKLHKEETKLISELKVTDAPEAKKSQVIATEELIDAIRRFQRVSDPTRLDRIAEVLEKLDLDKDGHVEVEHVLKVIELIGRENVKLNPKQIAEIVSIMNKEEGKGRKPKPV